METSASRFTAAEGGARLAASAANKNILTVECSTFIPVRLLYEKAYQIRGPLSEGRERSVYITRASQVAVLSYELNILTDLKVASAVEYGDVSDWAQELDQKEVLVCTSSVLRHVFEDQLLSMGNINMMVIDSCHLIYRDENLKYIMQLYKQCPESDRPIILALTYPPFGAPKKEAPIDKTSEPESTEQGEDESEKGEERKTIGKKTEIKKMGVYQNQDDFVLYEKLEWKIEDLERELCCQMDLAEDIDGGKRILSSTSKPRELIIEYGPASQLDERPEAYNKLVTYMKQTIQDALEFIDDHRHDPTEIYGDELFEELMSIPDPTIEPKQMFSQFMYVLEQLGPYAADKAALSLLIKLEKLKIKVPYERHFLLLCLCTTVFVKIRCHADNVFNAYDNDWEKIKQFCTPKVLRFAEILEKFKPPDVKTDFLNQNDDQNCSSEVNISGNYENYTGNEQNSSLDTQNCLNNQINRENDQNSSINDRNTTRNDQNITTNDQNTIQSDQNANKTLTRSESINKMFKDIETCDFTTLGDKLQDKVNTYASNFKEIHDLPSEFGHNSILTMKNNDKCNEIGPNENELNDFSNVNVRDGLVMQQKGVLGYQRRTGSRLRGTRRQQRSNMARALQMQQNPDALCAIVFMNEPFIANVMFLLVVDMSRSNPNLSYLCAQYCATESSPETRECQRQAKRQEEVLKKFRMHECNLLLATSALEEGIDLPRCNLVLRWDVPLSYRSYGMCRGRARALRSAAALLCTDTAHRTGLLLGSVAVYKELDQMISRKCGCGIQDEPPQSEEDHADLFTRFVKPYTPTDNRLVRDPTENEGDEGDDNSQVNSQVKGVKEIENIAGGEKNQVNIERDCDTIERDIKSQVKGVREMENVAVEERDGSSRVNTEVKSVKEMENVAEDKNKCLEEKDDNSLDNSEVKDVKELENSKTQFSNERNSSKEERDDKSLDSSAVKCVKEIENVVIDNKTQNHSKRDDKSLDNSEDKGVREIERFEVADKTQINSKKDTSIEERDANTPAYSEVKREIEIERPKRDEKSQNKTENQLKDVIINNIKGLVHYSKVNISELNINKTSENIILLNNKDENIQLENVKIQENDQRIDVNIAKPNKDLTNLNEIINKTSEIYIEDGNVIKINDNTIKSDSKNNLSHNKSNINIPLFNKLNKLDNKTVDNLIKTSDNDSKCQSDVSCKSVASDKKVDGEMGASVDLSTAIALINRYCGKLPSDTFTRLAPQWWVEEVSLSSPAAGGAPLPAYVCTLRLPLNCPVKYNIVGHPMPTKVLARRMVALQACRILHKSGELDDQLMPIGKENFKAAELEGCSNPVPCVTNETEDGSDARPGTTKRRQYYYKRTARAFTDCQPVLDAADSDPEKTADQPSTTNEEKDGCRRNMLYAISCSLWCALPERYNTRGRRLHAPQHADHAIAVLMARAEPLEQIPMFPVYTRSGEVRVALTRAPDADVRLTPRRRELVARFMRFVFSEVLRVRRRGMKLQCEGSTHNNYYIVPTIKSTRDDGTTKIDIDWEFLELIYQHTETNRLTELDKPILWREGERKKEKDGVIGVLNNPLLKEGETFVFDADKYKEAVVTPWYRNQDQPQFFLVAEICWELSPDSAFPSAGAYNTFRAYYLAKYGVSLTQPHQPLLDVDHTSARLNLLTPRYVNRKGVALPVSSERTRRAKRDRLDQKQILVPELCAVHPFAAPLWFATVALPCVLYRINALLIADEIRRAVAIDVGLGIPKINEHTLPGFQWPPLDFGWSLAEVLSADSEKNEKKKEEDEKRDQKESSDKEESEDLAEEGKRQEEPKQKTINDILHEKEDAEAGFEIGTWSNDMASSIPTSDDYDEYMQPLPPNLTLCTSAEGGANWCDPIQKPKFTHFNPTKTFSMADSDCSYMSSDLDTDDSDQNFESDEEDANGFCNSRNTNAAMGVRIEYKTAHEAEAVDVERSKKVRPSPTGDDLDDANDKLEYERIIREGRAPQEAIDKFRASVKQHKANLSSKNHLITQNTPIDEVLPPLKDISTKPPNSNPPIDITELFPYGGQDLILKGGCIDVESIEKNKRRLLQKIKEGLPKEKIKKMNCFAMKDVDIDSKDYVNEKVVNVGFDKKEKYESLCTNTSEFTPYYAEGRQGKEFDFDYQPKLEGHPGPSPSVILQALTMSNANDGINLERLETIGDSFLKFAITAYLYCAHPTVHEGKLSHMRSKQVSNLNLYRLGRNKRLGARMIASKFEPHDNWLPPCHKPPPTLHPKNVEDASSNTETPLDATGCFIPYNLITQHSIPDKSIADCVEALIGAYLLECGPRGALLFMSWLGIRVLPCHTVPLTDDHPYVKRHDCPKKPPTPPPKRQRTTSSSSECSDEEATPHDEDLFPESDWSWPGRPVGSLQPYKDEQGRWMQPIFGELKAPPSPLLRYIEDPEGELEQMLSGYEALERTLQYRFNDRSLLLQALTHASHHSNRLTDCYQRLEFLGDAILDYLITRHLYEDGRRHSPGALTDLRSALVNNTIFATLAARHGFHKYFRHMSPGLNEVLTKYVKIQEENGHSISEEHYLIQEDEMEQAEDVEVPKALGDLFESVAGAVFLDSGMCLGRVWRAYERLMGAELDAFSAAAPKSPVRELLEAEPDTAKFGKPERLADGRRVRVCVEVFGRGTFRGVGRNYRIAKGTAARCALRHLKETRPR